MKLNDSIYNVLKWIAIVFLPALITFVGVILTSLKVGNAEIVLTIMNAFAVFLGTILGVSTIKYNSTK